MIIFSDQYLNIPALYIKCHLPAISATSIRKRIEWVHDILFVRIN